MVRWHGIAKPQERTSWSTAPLVLTTLVVAWLAATGCRGESKRTTHETKQNRAVPNPLEQPAQFCFATCARKTICRLGKPVGKEQVDLFQKEKARCIQRCIQWMKGHPFDAQAYHRCYKGNSCSRMTACLAETRRLLQAAADPDRRRQCLSLCVDFGQCDASERRCMERCKAPDLAIYRALEHCENRSCPALRDCVVRYVPALVPTRGEPGQVAPGGSPGGTQDVATNKSAGRTGPTAP